MGSRQDSSFREGSGCSGASQGVGVAMCAPKHCLMLGQGGGDLHDSGENFRPSLRGKEGELVAPTQGRWPQSAF